MKSPTEHEPACTQPSVDVPVDKPENKVAFELPLRHHPTRLDDIPEDAESCASWDGQFEEETLEVLREDMDDTEETPPKSEVGYTDFYKAIIRGDVEFIKSQFDLGAIIERETDDGFSPLIIAIMEEQADVVKLLLEKGASVHHRSKRLPTLAHAVMKEQHGPEFMQLLLDRGAILNSISGPDQKTALHWAAAEGMAKSVEFLIGKGMDIEARCSRGRTALILAAEAGHEQVVKVLCAHGVDLHAKSENGGTALTWAACRDRIEVAKFLLDQGVEVDRRDKNGHTALSLASHFGHLTIVEDLLAHGANVNTRSDEPKGCTPAMAATCSNSIPVLKALIAHGADLSLRSAHGDCVLEIALIERKEDAVRALLEAIGDENYPRESVAMQIAMANTHAMIMSLMTTASVMHSYMEIKLGEPDKYAWMDWVLKQGGELVKPIALWKMMHAALEERDLPLVKALIEHGYDVNRRLESGHTPLSFAVGNDRGSNFELIQILLDAGADPNQEIPDGEGMNYTPFDHAIIDLDWLGPTAEEGINTEIVDLLLKSGRCKLNKGRDPASTAFSFVLSKSGEWGADVADALAIRMIDSIPNVNEDRDDIGCSLLHVAVHHQREDFVDLLLSRGADIEACTDNGYTSFILACQYSPKMLPVLIERGANVFAKYKSDAGALHAAAADGNLQAIKFLVEWGLNLEDETFRGYTPLACALAESHEATAMYLLSQGASARFRTTMPDQSALHFAARNALHGAVEEILKQDVNVNAKDDKGWTPLHEAAASGTPAIVSLLLYAGADIELPLPNGDRPLHVALVNGNEEIALRLVEHGADVLAEGAKNRTALHEAADYNLSGVAEVLLQKAPSLIEAVDDETWTPLCVCGHAGIVRTLIKHKANVNYTDKDGWTPLHQAVFNGDVEVAKLLIAAGASLGVRTTDDGLTVHERGMDLWDWGNRDMEKKVSPRLLTSCVAQRKYRGRKKQREEKKKMKEKMERQEAKRKEEEELEGLDGMYEVIEVAEE